ncbi:hypothetical protein D3C76_89730 [compost metagenome]
MSTVESYLRDQFAGKETPLVSMEASGMEQIFGRFELPSIYAPQKLTIGPWNRPGSEEHYTDEWLDKATYQTGSKSFETPIAAWLMLGGEDVGDRLFECLDAEKRMYQVILAMVQQPIFANITWAQVVTGRLDKVNKDTELAKRPKTAAEMLSGVKPCLLGMREREPLVKVVPFRGDVLTTFQIPQRPDYGQTAHRFRLDAEKAKRLVYWAATFDGLGDHVDALFQSLHREVSKLKPFKELVTEGEEPHVLLQYLDREMQNPLNTEVLCSLYSRARAIANHLRMIVWCETH